MAHNLIYIGTNPQYISHYKDITEDTLTIVHNYEEFERVAETFTSDDLLIILYEKQNLESDSVIITNIHSLFKKVNIILIFEELTKESAKEYLKLGVNNTSQYNSSKKENLLNYLNFITKHQEALTLEPSESQKISHFKLPLWKRCFDIIFSLAAMIALAPFIIIIVIAIRAESKGKVMYKAKRVGSNYNVFDFFKFRSMYSNADKQLGDLDYLNQYSKGGDNSEEGDLQIAFDDLSDIEIDENGNILFSDDFTIDENIYLNDKNEKIENSFIKITNDPRITKVGLFIRKYSIDELPQLINILKGDMSVVGNRPLPPYEAEKLLCDGYVDRFIAPAGLTGLWQIEKRGQAGKLSAEERKLLDIKYAKDFNFFLDIKIILKTFTAFIQKENV